MRAAKGQVGQGREVEEILDDLRRVVCVLHGCSRKVERLTRLTPAQAWLITALSREEPAKVSDLARIMRLRPSAIIQIVGRLEELGLAVRTRPSNNAGIVKVALTHVGTKLACKIPALPQETLLNGLSKIPPDRLQAVSEGLEALVQILGAREVVPQLFFAPVSNLAAGERSGLQRVVRPFPGKAMTGRGGGQSRARKIKVPGGQGS